MSTKALIVGIAKYANPRNNLDGVEKDVSAIIGLLGKFGITDLEVIRDSNATANNIRNGLRNLVTETNEGDIRIFYFSGHGTLLPSSFSNGNGNEQDEAIVPYEGTLSSLIIDNWMAEFLKNILPKTTFFWGIYDSCFSGDMFKFAEIEGGQNSQQKIIPFENLVFDTMPCQISPRVIKQPTVKELILDGIIENSVHFGAAEANTTALVQEIEGIRRSVFTWALEQTAKPELTVSEFDTAVTIKQATVTNHHKPQVACSEKNKGRKLFT